VPSRGRNSNSLLTVTEMVRNSYRLDSWGAGFDIVKVNLAFLERINKRSTDDIVVGVATIFVGLTVDISNRRRPRRAEMAEQRLRVLKATMRTVQHILKNFLNNIPLLQTEAESAVPEETLEQLDGVVEDAAKQTWALGNLDEEKEKLMGSGVGIDYTAELSHVA
jgi:hypothetical protein